MPSRFNEGDNYDITDEEQGLIDRASELDVEASNLASQETDIDKSIEDLAKEKEELSKAYSAKAEECLRILAQLDAAGIDFQDVQAIAGEFLEISA